MTKKLTWSTVKVKLGDLKEWDKNPVKISERDARELAKSIDRFDHVLPYVAAAPLPKGKRKAQSVPLLDGHQRKRVELSLRKGVTAETVVEVRVPSRALTEKERAEIAVRLRKNTGEFDDKKLLEWFDSKDLLDWGFDQDELEDIGFEFDDETKDTEPQIERAEELLKKWKVKLGDLWALGEHRLICGDCTDAAIVAMLMREDRADVVLTDPPYSVNYGAKNRALQTIAKGNRLTSDIEGDDLSTEETAERIWGPAFENAYNYSRNGTVIYCFAPQGGDQMMMMMMKAKWNERLHQLIWRKNSPTFSMGRLDYSYQHEPILYSWRGTNHRFYGKSARSVIDCDRPSASKLHPTMKPVQLFQILLQNSSREQEIVYEPFNGSGTTLIACENLKRKCRAIELDPKYVAVILERFYEHTGILPKLVK